MGSDPSAGNLPLTWFRASGRPDRSKSCSRAPQIPPRKFKTAPRAAQSGPRPPKIVPRPRRPAREQPRALQNHPRFYPEPSRASLGPLCFPEAPQAAPRSPQGNPRALQDRPKKVFTSGRRCHFVNVILQAENDPAPPKTLPKCHPEPRIS